MATRASRIALAGSNISSTGEVDADLLDNTDSAAFLSLAADGNFFIGTSSDIAPANGTNLYVSDGTISRFGLEKTGSDARKFSINNGGTYFSVYDETADAERFRISSTGNVGIGTNSPGSKLHVSGGHIRAENTGTDAYFFEGIRAGAQTTLRIYDNANNLYIDSHSNMSFRANQTGGSGGNFHFGGGNVGIGTNNPQTKLHISGVSENIRVHNTGTGNYGLEIWRGSNKGASFAWGEGNANLEIKNYRNDSQADGPYANIDFFTGGTNATNPNYNPDLRMRIQQTGEVGIGTSNPGEKLHVEGSIRASGNIGVTQTDGDYLAKLYQSSADGFLELYTGEGTPVSRVKFSAYGNSYIAPSTTSGLGLGTTSPSERLHVVGDIQQQSTHNGSDKCIEAFFNIATNTSYNTVWTANINNQHQGMFYEVICYGGDWSSHSSARVIKRGFVNGYNGYTGHQEIESAGPYASNISGQLLWSGNTVTYQMRLDVGGATLRGMVRLIGHFTGYTVY